MSADPTTLSTAQAQSLMSRLLDGELSSSEADKLHAYLERHPDAMDWMESNQLIQTSDSEAPHVDASAAWKDIQSELSESETTPEEPGKVIRFPIVYQLLGYAAAVTLIGSLAWTSLTRSDSHIATESYAASESVVEFVDTEIPDASPIVYTDEASGWTVVWVEQMEPLPDETG